MKNLFKNLMLVAVAAMAFTACTETNDEVNAVSKTTRYEFTANIAEETRSGFAEKEEGAKAYKSEWHEGDQVKIFVDGYEPIVANVTTEGKFAFELTGAPESFFMTVCSPAESWSSRYTANLPEVQTPLANSVDPKAHLLQAQNVSVSNGSADAIDMTHQIAYGKMTVNGVDFAIDHVVVDLKGSFFGYDRELSYTISAANVDNNTFWFATEPIDVAEFTVTAYDAEGNSVTKTVDVAEAGKTMSFNYGRVGTFSVSGLEEYVAPSAPMFTTAYTYADAGSNDKKIFFEGGSLAQLVINVYGDCLSGNIWAEGVYTTEFVNNSLIFSGSSSKYDGENIKTIKVTVSHVAEGYHILFENVMGNESLLLESATFTGTIDGMNTPSGSTPEPTDPVQLATPNATATDITAESITVSWNAVANASGYAVTINGGAEQSVATTSYTFSGLEAETAYVITVVAKGNGVEYLDSSVATVNATTLAAQTGGDEGGAVGTEANPYVLEVSARANNGWWIEFTCPDNGAFLHLELNGPIFGCTYGVEYSLHDKGPWYSSGHYYTINDVTYHHDKLCEKSTSITKKLSTGECQTLFKIEVGGTVVYYTVVTPSTY